MKNPILAAALATALALPALAMPALAQTAPATNPPAVNPDGNKPAVATPDTKNPTAPVEGANSFTEAQAKSRIEQAGYSGVKDLQKNDKGVWVAAGMKDGKPVTVVLDYQGNVVAQ